MFEKDNLVSIGIGVAVFVVLLVIFVGPARLKREYDNHRNSAYGADWLVIESADDGTVVHYWELENRSIGNEKESDGIYFTDNSGFQVHLSGRYKYVQIHGKKWAEARKAYVEPWQPKEIEQCK